MPSLTTGATARHCRPTNRISFTFGRALKNSLRSKNMGYALMRNDFLTESILRILGPVGGIKRAMECDRPLWVL